jgi:putative ABC transport system substrate-binding protein
MRRREFLTGSAALATAWPSWVSAELSGKLHRVGWPSPGVTADPKFPLWVAFMEGFRDLGYAEGQNLMLEGRFAGGDLERLPVLARELVAMSVEVLVVFGPTPMRAAQAVAQDVVPIVMVAGRSDPVAEGYVARFARPGTNVTGLTYAVSAERFGKQLEFLKEAISVSRVALLWDGTIEIFNRSCAPALNEAARQVQAVLVASSGVLGQSSDRLAEVALRHRMPVMAAFREFTEAGILMSYGPNMPATYRRAAVFVDKILKSTPPGEIPVEQPVSHDLIINLKTARALGLTLPPAVLARADEVIE